LIKLKTPATNYGISTILIYPVKPLFNLFNWDESNDLKDPNLSR
jgi:hypothetical protein